MAENPQWLIKIKTDLHELGDTSSQSTHWSKKSIYRIPASVTELHKRVYTPQIVSIGPYHHGHPHLLPMEEHKRRALLHFLKMADKPIDAFVGAMSPMVQDLKDTYDRLGPPWDDDNDESRFRFLRMMITDGCFILEVLRTTMEPGCAGEEEEVYAPNDPIFSNHGRLYIVPYLKRDMLMLENQIPMVVLDTLVALQGAHAQLKHGKELIRLILKFFSQSIPHKTHPHFENPLHILQIYRANLLLLEGPPHPPRKRHKNPKPDRGDEEQIIRSATELNEAGIRIEKSRTRSLRDISFHKGTLRLPIVVVDDALESLYLNLIAFERFHVGAGNEVTSYIFFMDNIIDSARDVSLLHSCGIVQNAMGSDKAVANLFNSLSKDITLDPENRLDEVHKKVSRYCRKPWNQWRANLMHTYFTNPWAVLSVFAAALLFALTILQTIYSVLSYVKPPQ